MFSHEVFDFASTGHLSDAHLDAPDPYHDLLFDSYIDSSCVDQSFCSDFACCGQKLPDLHRLLEHFEEEHVLPLPPDARPLFSSPVYAQPRSAALSPYTSYILSYPQPDPPLPAAAAHSISVSQSPGPTSDPGSRALPSLQFGGIPPLAGAVPDLTHTPLSPSPTASSATSAHSSPGPSEPLCLPPALFSVQPSAGTGARPRRDRPRPRATSDTDIDVDDTDEEESSDAPPARPAPTSRPSLSLSGSGNTTGPHRRAKTKTKSSSAARMEPFASASAARTRPAERERAPLVLSPASPKRRDGREKAFRCPHPGCTKSYLNPNGLKYHLEKGTCTNADARARERDPLPSDPCPCPVAVACLAAPATAVDATMVLDLGSSAVVGEAGDATHAGAADTRV